MRVSNTLERLIHRYRIAKNLGLEEEAAIIAVQIAEAAQKEMESGEDEEKSERIL